MEISKSAVLGFNGNKYRLREIMKGLAQYPVIEVSAKEINSWLASNEFNADCSEEIDTGLNVLFFKQKGKYTVLVGKQVLESLVKSNPGCVIHGKLISTPALKKTRIDPNAVFVPDVVKTQVTPPSHYGNTRPVDRYGDVEVRSRSTFKRTYQK